MARFWCPDLAHHFPQLPEGCSRGRCIGSGRWPCCHSLLCRHRSIGNFLCCRFVFSVGEWGIPSLGSGFMLVTEGLLPLDHVQLIVGHLCVLVSSFVLLFFCFCLCVCLYLREYIQKHKKLQFTEHWVLLSREIFYIRWKQNFFFAFVSVFLDNMETPPHRKTFSKMALARSSQFRFLVSVIICDSMSGDRSDWEYIGDDSWSVVCAACCHMALVFAIMLLHIFLIFVFIVSVHCFFIHFF